MKVSYFILCLVFVVFLIKFFIHCCEVRLNKKSHKKLVKNMSLYKNTRVGALENDRLNERQKKKS